MAITAKPLQELLQFNTSRISDTDKLLVIKTNTQGIVTIQNFFDKIIDQEVLNAFGEIGFTNE